MTSVGQTADSRDSFLHSKSLLAMRYREAKGWWSDMSTASRSISHPVGGQDSRATRPEFDLTSAVKFSMNLQKLHGGYKQIYTPHHNQQQHGQTYPSLTEERLARHQHPHSIL